jgi:hypothetical protein
MNKVVVVGVAVVVIVAAIAAILLLNHPNSSNYSTTTNTVITPSSTTVTPTTSTNINSTTSTSTNTSLNLQMNSFYFVGENSTGYYYMFVLNLTSYKESLQESGDPKATIIDITVLGTDKYIIPTQIIEKSDYLFVIGYIRNNSNSSTSFNLGDAYPISFWLNDGGAYTTQMIYEGNWTGSLP